MLLLYLMVKMVGLKELCFIAQMPEQKAHLFEEVAYGNTINRSRLKVLILRW